MLLLLPACGIPNLRPSLPGPALPAKYSSSYPGANTLENSAQVPIEDFFNDPFLSGLICQGLVGNQELRILYEDVQIARNEILGRSGAYLPFVGLHAAGGIERFSQFTPLGAAERQLTYLPGRHFPDPSGIFLATADISWQVDIWRMLRNAKDAAVQRYLASNEGRNYAITRLVADIAENYYMLLALDKRMENLDNIIALQQQSLKFAEAKRKFGRGTELGVQRFKAEVSMNQSQKLITRQTIIEIENRINFLVGRYPQPVERSSVDFMAFINLSLNALKLGMPVQLLQNRPDIRQAERELAAAGLDVKSARARFFPRLDIGGPPGPTGPVGPLGWQAFNPKYLFWTPEALLANVVADLTVPLINKRAIKADYKTANARQLQAIYNYQRVLLKAYTEVVTRVSRVQNYSSSIEIKKQQVQALQKSVEVANQLFQRAYSPIEEASRRVDYMDVLFAQRDLWEARLLLIETKEQQLAAIVHVYQALGGGLLGCGCGDPRLAQRGPSLDQSQQGGSDSSGTDQLPSPRPLPASEKLPDQPPDAKPAQPSGAAEPNKSPTYLPSAAATTG